MDKEIGEVQFKLAYRTSGNILILFAKCQSVCVRVVYQFEM